MRSRESHELCLKKGLVTKKNCEELEHPASQVRVSTLVLSTNPVSIDDSEGDRSVLVAEAEALEEQLELVHRDEARLVFVYCLQ